jgi:small subunit ribosomal protein S1
MSATDGPRESFAALFESQGPQQQRRRFHPGENIEVTIVLVAREAVFADLGGKQEGMFELASLSDDDGNVQVKVGNRVMAVVERIDRETGQVRLKPVAVKAEADAEPVALATTKGAGPLIAEGARIKGAVTGIERYGVFVQIAGTKDRAGRGLVPASETGTPRNADMKKHFTVGQELEAKILAVAPDGKIRLSITALKGDDERADLAAYQKAEEKKRDASERPVRGFGTLGDLMKGVKATPAKPAAPAKPAGPAKGKR